MDRWGVKTDNRRTGVGEDGQRIGGGGEEGQHTEGGEIETITSLNRRLGALQISSIV